MKTTSHTIFARSHAANHRVTRYRGSRSASLTNVCLAVNQAPCRSNTVSTAVIETSNRRYPIDKLSFPFLIPIQYIFER